MPPKNVKDRPRSTDKSKGKRRDGTPDKSLTPGGDDESGADSRPNVLDNEEIRSLAIKNQEDQLVKIRAELNAEKGSTAPTAIRPLKVRKVKESVPPVKKTLIKVARGAPPGAQIVHVPEELEQQGPSFDNHGKVVPHSILGTIEEFNQVARARGRPATPADASRPTTPSVYSGKPHKPKYSDRLDLDDPSTRALDNWNAKMNERKIQQWHVAGTINRPLDQLVMNQGDRYRKTQEVRYLVDRAIPAYDYGKGYRVGSEFWAQPQRIADDITGVSLTLNKMQQGYPPTFEQIRIPNLTQPELNTFPVDKENEDKIRQHQKPWHQTDYLRKRMDELKPVMNDLVPHHPAADALQVSGAAITDTIETSRANPIEEELQMMETAQPEEQTGKLSTDPLAAHPDVYSAPIFGPALRFAGETLSWTGDGSSFASQIAVDARVSFEALTKQRSTSQLTITNVGTSAIYYDWEKIPHIDHFNIPRQKVQRFYFNTSNGSILPGDTLNFPFVFKSDNAGIFTEQWRLNTSPRLAGGAGLIVTLRGVSIREDKYKWNREQIERDIQRAILEKGIRQILNGIVDNIKERQRPRSPIDSYITKETMFKRLHPQLHYKHDIVEKLVELHETFEASQRNLGPGYTPRASPIPEPRKPLDIAEFKMEVMEMSEDDEQRTIFLESINDAILNLSFPVVTLRLRKMFQHCHHHLADFLDGMNHHSSHLRQLMGLPDKSTDMTEEGSKGDAKGKSAVAPKSTVKTPGKEEKKSGKGDPKKDPKQKESAKKDKDNGRGSPTKKGPTTPAKPTNLTSGTSVSGASETEKPEGEKTAGDKVDTALMKKYKERFNMQVYSDMRALIQTIVDGFIGITEETEELE